MGEHDESEVASVGANETQETAEHSEAAAPTELEEALAKIEALEAKVEELKNDAARTRADFYNYRTRIERDRAKDRVLAAEGACDALLPVLDNLDRTLEAVEDKASPLFKGVAMVQKQFLAAMKGLGLEEIDTSGKFDPKTHEAVMTVDVEDESEDGNIIGVMTKGYKLGEKLLRAAMVKVARIGGGAKDE